MAEDFTAKFKVDVSDLKKGISEANKQIKLANATFKAETAGMENWSKDADGLSKKLETLKKVLTNQKTVLSSYQSQLQRQQQAYDENGRKAEQLKAKLKELAEQGVSKTDAEYQKYEKALNTVQKEQENNGKACDNLKLSIVNAQGAVNKTEADIEKYGKALDDVTRETKEAEDAANRQKTAYEQLTDKVNEQQTELADLKKKYAEVVVEQGKDSEAAKDLQREIYNLSTELQDNKKKLNDADKAADDFDKSLEETEDEAVRAQGGMDAFKVALGDLVSQAITAAINALKDMAKATYDAWKAFDEGADNITALTGKTGESAADMMSVYKNLGKSVKADFSEIGNAVGEVSTRFDIAGQDLENVSKAFLQYADINNTDVKNSVDSVQSAMAAFGVSTDDTLAFLDMLTATAQSSGTSVDTLTSAMVQNAPSLMELGYSASDAAQFVGQLSKNGIEVSAVMGGMKKALVNATKAGKPLDTQLGRVENSIAKAGTSTQATERAMALFGNKAGASIATAVRDGRLSFKQLGTSLDDFKGSVENTYESMQSAPEKIQLGIQNLKMTAAELFQNVLEKHGDKIEALIEHITTETLPKVIEAVDWFITNLPTISKIVEALNLSPITKLVDKFGELKDSFKTIGEDASNTWQTITDAASSAWESIEQFFSDAWAKVEDVWGNLVQFFSDLWNGIKDIYSGVADWINNNVFQPIKDFFQPVVTFFSEAFTIIGQLASGCWEIIKRVWGVVSDWFNTKVIQPVKKFFTDTWDKIKQAASNAWTSIKNTWTTVSNWFNTTVIQPVQRFFSDMWGKLSQGASDAWTAIKNVFSNVTNWFRDKFTEAWTAVKNVFSTGGEIFTGITEGITAAFKRIVNGIIGGINRVISVPFNAINNALDRIRNVNILGISPFSGLGSVSVPQIPLLAQGGILKKGQIGLLEGSGAEAVVPLSQNRKWVRSVATEMLNQISNRPSVNNNSTVKTNNTSFTQIINAPKQPSRIELYRMTKNLLTLSQGGIA